MIASKVALFHGYVVTCDPEDRIPLSSSVIGEPITHDLLVKPFPQQADANPIMNQIPKAATMVAVDAMWLVSTLNALIEASWKKDEKKNG